MKHKSKSSLFITALAVFAAVMALVVPSLYEPVSGKLIMGFSTTFGGTISYNNYPATIGFPVGLFMAWLLLIFAGALAFFFGTGQKSTYFFTFCLFIASLVLYAFTSNFTIADPLVAGGIPGFSACEWCAQVWIMIVLNSIGAIASLVAIFYKPNRRTSKYR